MARNETEHSPMSGFDEYPIHQFGEPLRVVNTTDARAYERYWFTAEDEGGEFFLVTGFGIYPNLDTADAYAIFVHEDKHTSVRMHRLLGDDRADLTFGPLRAEILEPFREWSLSLGDNEEDFRFDLRWRDSKRAVFHRVALGGSTSRRGRLIPDLAGYESFGRIEGSIEYKGKKFEVSPKRVRGSRDHHWGVRNGVGGPALNEPDSGLSHCGQWVEFGDWSIWGRRCLYNLGDERSGAASITAMTYQLRFDPETKFLTGGTIRNTLQTGEVKEVHYEQIGYLTAYLRCGMYSGPKGGTPDGNIFHGMYVGDEVVSGRTDDLSDAKVRMDLGGFEDHLCIARCGDETTVGILECKNPVLYKMCKEGYPGFSLLEE